MTPTLQDQKGGTHHRSARALPELWGGLECTVNRVGDRYFNQIARTGHDRRHADLDALASLGIKRLRYPILWELTAPKGIASADWSWADQRMGRLRELGIMPIVGLVHHGSGPPYTNLLDSSFATGLSEFAQSVAERYPWVDAYTPVNEPLTTARFSALYGLWHPHERNDHAFATAVLNQCKAVAMSMQAIRRVNPAAQLIQTDDLGKVFSTPALAAQAEFENHRRWITFDLLCGMLDRDHALWEWLMAVGIAPDELQWFLDHPCPPDILGFNYYITSERFLDDRVERYSPRELGGNGWQRYADVEAVRVRPEGIAGAQRLLTEAWDRFSRPMAITEIHLNCDEDEQIRWFCEVWEAAIAVRSGGADLRAVTAWSLLGAYDWDCLVSECRDHYEPGVFDVRDGTLRPTAMVNVLRELARDGRSHHPAIGGRGWWHRPERLTFPSHVHEGAAAESCSVA